MPSNKKHVVFFVFVKFVRKMQFIFTLTNNSFDPDFDLDVKYKHWRPVSLNTPGQPRTPQDVQICIINMLFW